MKKYTLFLLLTCTVVNYFAQNSVLDVKKYVLDNGFTVYLNEDKTAKSVYGAVVTKAGSKNDPADATGMAHYLEHLLFKGTTELGTTNYEKEKPFLDSINIYYDMLGKTKDPDERKKIQLLINNQSVQAAQYALPTEFDKLIKSIGGTDLNAFTAEDMTAFHNVFPGEQIDKWLELYSHRLQHPVFRSFQSELEVVYEEKNKNADYFFTALLEEINKNMFKYHPYGTQTTIGTIEHLKNPSLTKMYDYFNTYYVANNMALVLSGNFDAEKTLPVIKEKFSKLRTGTLPAPKQYQKTVFNGKESVTVKYSPIKLEAIGFKGIPNVHPDKAALEVCMSLLSNESETGRLNKLKREGKVLESICFNEAYNDDGNIIFVVIPKLVGQSLEAAEKLVLGEIEKVKNGEISDTELQIVKTELYRQRQQELENIDDRALSIVQTFSQGSSWESYLSYTKELDKITKEDVIRVAKQYFGNNYFVLYSERGHPKNEKIEKPGFKSVATDQKEESAYAAKFQMIQSPAVSPKFLDFDADAKLTQLNTSNKLYVTPNPVNDLFSLQVVLKTGSDSIKNLDIAASTFTLFHTSNFTIDSMKEAFALLGVTYSAECTDQRFTIRFDGLERNFEKALPLINKLMYQPVVDAKSVKTTVGDIITERGIEETTPDTEGRMLREYIKLGNRSKYINRISTKELKKLKPEDVLSPYKRAVTYNAVWHYTGTKSSEQVHGLLKANITLPDNKKEIALVSKNNNAITENAIYFVNDKKAVQSQIYYVLNSLNYVYSPKTDAQLQAFDEYMGGDFSGLILQEIREYRSLAYSAWGGFTKPKLQNNPAYFTAYIGCQADKTNESIDVMNGLLNNMPQHPERIDFIKLQLKNSVAAEYPNFRDISTTIEDLRERGYTSSHLETTYPQYDLLTFDDINNFYKSYIQNKPIAISIYGNKDKINMVKLGDSGKIRELKKSKIIVK